MAQLLPTIEQGDVVTGPIRSNQKFFTEAEAAGLTGICLLHLRCLANENNLGTVATALIAGERAESWLFTKSDLLTLAVFQSRCQH
jgi:hypothetical protein